MQRVDIAGGVILNPRREILLVYNHETDSWTYPKGHVNPGESLLEAALREIEEETSMKNLNLVCELPVYERPTRQQKGKIKVMHMYLFTSEQEDTKSNTADIARIRWVPIQEVAGYFSYQEEVDFFNSIKERLKSY